MSKLFLMSLSLGAALLLAPDARAGGEADFKAAYAAAEAANREAGALKNRWTVTDAALKQAQQAAAAQRYEDAVRLARSAEALANASIAQAKEQDKDWEAAVIR